MFRAVVFRSTATSPHSPVADSDQSTGARPSNQNALFHRTRTNREIGMSIVRTATLLSVLAATVGCTEDPSADGRVVGEVPITSQFETRSGTWRGGSRGSEEVAYVWGTTEIDGMIALCGAYHISSVSVAKAQRSLNRVAFASYKDQIILRDLSFAKKANSLNDLQTGTARCALTSLRAADYDGSGIELGSNQSRFASG
jgi:hypothetical protein